MDSRPIGVFDSGVGGLSVLIELKKLLPHENFVFLADQLYVPYGEKSKEQLVKLNYKVANYLRKNHNVKIMVVACNTSTVNAIKELRAKYLVPIVGTVPAVKPAAEQTKTGIIGVISTPSTSKSAMLKKRIKDFCKGVQVLNVGCKGLEDTVERGDLYSQDTKNLLEKYLKTIVHSDVDHLVLGCTHYPFLKKSIQKIVGPKIVLVDSGKAIAKRTQTLILENKLKNGQKSKSKTLYFTTGDSVKFSKVASKLLAHKVKAEKVKI